MVTGAAPKKDTARQTLTVRGLRSRIEQQVQHRGTRLTRCRCTRKQVLNELTQRLSARLVRRSEGLEGRTSDRLD